MTSPPQHPPRNRIVITTACSKGEMSWAHHANGAVRRPPSRRSSASYRAPRSHRSGTISTLDGTIPNNIGEIDHLIIDKVSGRVAYAVMSFGGFMVLEPGNGQGFVQPTRSASRPAPPPDSCPFMYFPLLVSIRTGPKLRTQRDIVGSRSAIRVLLHNWGTSYFSSDCWARRNGLAWGLIHDHLGIDWPTDFFTDLRRVWGVAERSGGSPDRL